MEVTVQDLYDKLKDCVSVTDEKGHYKLKLFNDSEQEVLDEIIKRGLISVIVRTEDYVDYRLS